MTDHNKSIWGMVLFLLDDSWTCWVPVATVVHDYTGPSIQEGVKDSNEHFQVISITVRILIIKKWHSAQILLEATFSIMVILIGNKISDPSSNPEQSCLHFPLH